MPHRKRSATVKKNEAWVWWKHGVIYQIYPRSFMDSNGDGIGDIAGITGKLDYIRDLGVDAVWLSPINSSPMHDFGYDISDYRGIEPIFGTPAEFDRFIREAHRRGIRVIMDLVLNHTSHLHPWFVESRSSRTSPKRDWYIWHDGINGKPPNNWMASFGGRAWEWDEATGQYYLHSFLKEQPDVNWRNPALRKAMWGEVKFWLDRGVDGFRLDVVNWFIKDDKLRSNPFTIGEHPRPYDMQKHIYDRNRPETHDIVREFRKLLDRYDSRMSVGEVFAEKPGDPVLSASYLGDGTDELHLAFDFSLIFTPWDARAFQERVSMYDAHVPPRGWPCWVLSNHDQPRSLSRLGRGKDALARARVAAVMLLTLRGTPFIYYGEEIGMRDGKVRRRELKDPVGVKYWPFNNGRDPERTPMQWSDADHAGFSTGTPWLPLGRDFHEVNVERESRDPGSMLSFYRELLRLRREKPALNRGAWIAAEDLPRGVMAYYRIFSEQECFVALNFGAKPRSVQVEDDSMWKVIFSTRSTRGEVYASLRFTLAPFEAVIFEKLR